MQRVRRKKCFEVVEMKENEKNQYAALGMNFLFNL
jgi:hypothetical protein